MLLNKSISHFLTTDIQVSALSVFMHSHKVIHFNNTKLEEMQEAKTVFYLLSLPSLKH